MFETTDYAEIPIHEVFREEGARAWAYVSHPLHVPWFHLVYRYPIDEGGTLSRPIFLTQIFQLLEFEQRSGIKVEEVQIVLPQHMTGAGRWTMEPLAEIWEGVEPNTQGQRAHVFVLANGKRYLRAGVTANESDLLDQELVFRSPVKT